MSLYQHTLYFKLYYTSELFILTHRIYLSFTIITLSRTEDLLPISLYWHESNLLMLE